MNHLSKKTINIHKALRGQHGKKIQKSLTDPLDALIATILSQNTSDKNSLPAFYALKSRFKTWDAAARSDIKTIERTIRPAGLFRTKARVIKAALNEISKREGRASLERLKDMGDDEAEEYLSSLKGVGPKTVACVMIFSLGRAYFPVDTHILRISRRLGLIKAAAGAGEAHEYYKRSVPKEKMYELHLNMIEHGRHICRAHHPLCGDCALSRVCSYFKGAYSKTTIFPVERARLSPS